MGRCICVYAGDICVRVFFSPELTSGELTNGVINTALLICFTR